MNFKKPTQADFDYVSAHAFEGAVKNYPYQQVPDDKWYEVSIEDNS